MIAHICSIAPMEQRWDAGKSLSRREDHDEDPDLDPDYRESIPHHMRRSIPVATCWAWTLDGRLRLRTQFWAQTGGMERTQHTTASDTRDLADTIIPWLWLCHPTACFGVTIALWSSHSFLIRSSSFQFAVVLNTL